MMKERGGRSRAQVGGHEGEGKCRMQVQGAGGERGGVWEEEQNAGGTS